MQVHEARRECDYWRHLHGQVHVNAQAQASQHATEREAAGAALEALRARVEQAGSEARAEALTMARAELDASHVAVRELQASVEALTARAAQAEAQAREAIEREWDARGAFPIYPVTPIVPPPDEPDGAPRP
jgi:hypothetical protein